MPIEWQPQVRLRGLDPAARYRVRVWPEVDDTFVRRNALVRGGDELMSAGLFLDDSAREFSVAWRFPGSPVRARSHLNQEGE